MIQKIIHYCRFWNNNKPEYVKKCIESRNKYAPEYRLKEWNEKNCDINANKRVKKAYKAGKWAFVADYFRLLALYNEWWVYLDTDMELVQPLCNLIDEKYDAIRWFDSRTNFSAWFIASKNKHKFLYDLISIYNQKLYDWETINSILNKYFPKHWIFLNWIEQYSKDFNTIFFEANKISVDIGDWNAFIIDHHANSRCEWRKVNHFARCYLDYLAVHNQIISDAIDEIHKDYESSIARKLWNSIVLILKKIKLDKLYFYVKSLLD